MRTIPILLTLAACTDTTGTVDDPRAVSCETFRGDSYRRIPMQTCVFDVSGLDWEHEFGGVSSAPLVIPGCTNSDCPLVGSAQLFYGNTYKAGAITWLGDRESEGIAVVIGGIADLPSAEWTCIWQRCLRVE